MIHICLSTNQAYIIFTKMCIYNIICRKKPETELVFYVLADNFIFEQKPFEVFNKVSGVAVVTIPMDSNHLLPKVDTRRLVSTRPGLPKTMYLRFLAPVIPQLRYVNRLLYIDPDMVCRRDISDLYHTDIQDKPLAMVKDSFYIRYDDDGERMKTELCGYNAGLIIMDLPKLRKLNFTGFCMRMVQTHPYNDQAVINQLFRNDVYPLLPTAQFPIHNLVQHIKNMDDIDKWNQFHGTSYTSLEEIIRQSYFYHFHEDKSWQMRIPILKEFWEFSLARLAKFEFTEVVEFIDPKIDATWDDRLLAVINKKEGMGEA